MADSIAFIPPIYHVRERLATTNVVECRENITPVNSIADRLKKAREAAGLTQPELAPCALGVVRPCMSLAWAARTRSRTAWLPEPSTHPTSRPPRRLFCARATPKD